MSLWFMNCPKLHPTMTYALQSHAMQMENERQFKITLIQKTT